MPLVPGCGPPPGRYDGNTRMVFDIPKRLYANLITVRGKYVACGMCWSLGGVPGTYRPTRFTRSISNGRCPGRGIGKNGLNVLVWVKGQRPVQGVTTDLEGVQPPPLCGSTKYSNMLERAPGWSRIYCGRMGNSCQYDLQNRGYFICDDKSIPRCLADRTNSCFPSDHSTSRIIYQWVYCQRALRCRSNLESCGWSDWSCYGYCYSDVWLSSRLHRIIGRKSDTCVFVILRGIDTLLYSHPYHLFGCKHID